MALQTRAGMPPGAFAGTYSISTSPSAVAVQASTLPAARSASVSMSRW